MRAIHVVACVGTAVALSGCFDQLLNQPPRSGTYVSADGAIYSVSTTGPSALSVSNSETCLLFWRLKEPQIVDGVEVLRGQDCHQRQERSLEWTARYDYDAPDRFTLIGPDGEGIDIDWRSEKLE